MSQEAPASPSGWLSRVTNSSLKADVPELHPGDQVRVWSRIFERDRIRLTPFEGLVISRQRSGLSATVTVRRVTYGEGVERVFPLHAPVLERIEVLRRGKTRRARLYFLRTKIGKTRIAAAQPDGPANPSSSREGRGKDAQRPEEDGTSTQHSEEAAPASS